MTSTSWCEQTWARAEGELVARRGGRQNEACTQVEGTSTPFMRLELRVVLSKLEKAQVSSSSQVVTGRSWGSAENKRGGRIVRVEERKGERKDEGKRKKKKKKEKNRYDSGLFDFRKKIPYLFLFEISFHFYANLVRVFRYLAITIQTHTFKS